MVRGASVHDQVPVEADAQDITMYFADAPVAEPAAVEEREPAEQDGEEPIPCVEGTEGQLQFNVRTFTNVECKKWSRSFSGGMVQIT